MKPKYFLFFTMCCFFSSGIFAQITDKTLQPFIGKSTLIGKSGPGLNAASGDILLELGYKDDPDVETVMLLRNSEGKLSKIAENSSLLMGQEILGISGGNYPDLSGNMIFIDYTIGSNSAQSDISINFEKNNDGNYYFKEYTSKTRNYGVENLFNRQKINAQQAGRINFSEASESKIIEKSKVNLKFYNEEEPPNELEQKCAKYIPKGWGWTACSEGDLNMDGKKDLLVVLFNEENCEIRLLLQQKDGSYKTAQTNDELIVSNEIFNANNLKTVIKNGFFTIEQRISIDDNNFDHRYTTFKYDVVQKNWYLHRFDVEHYTGFNAKPSKVITHLSPIEFGKITFQELKNLPGVYYFEPATSVVSGTLTQKQFYGRPNYGVTPQTDEKVRVYLLKPDFPVNVYGAIDPQEPETADNTITNISEIQIYSIDKKMELKKYEGKKIKLLGVFQSAQTGSHYTPVIFEVKRILL